MHNKNIYEIFEKDKSCICRICLSYDDEKMTGWMSLFDKYSEMYVYEKIIYITSIEISQDDDLPDRICSTCLQALENACNFKQQCERSDAFLHSTFHTDEPLKEEEIEYPIKEEGNTGEYEYNCLQEDSTHSSLEHENEESKPNIEEDTQSNVHDETQYNIGEETLSNIGEDAHSNIGEDAQSNIGEETQQIIKEEFQSDIDEEPHLNFKSKAIDLTFECHDCGGIFKSKCKLRVHWKKIHLYEQLICPHCKRTHKTYKAFHKHKKNKTNCIDPAKVRVEGLGKSRIFYCKECNMHCKRPQDLIKHLHIHSGEKPYVCSICNKGFTQKPSLQSHMECIHKQYIKIGTCELCGKHLKGRLQWYKHMRRHKNLKFPCSVCNKQMSSRDALNDHMKRHSGVKSVTCEICAKTFYTTTDLSTHKSQRHFKTKLYSCNKCDYKTLHSTRMSKHKPKHTGSNVACNVCGTFVENNQQLVLHQKRHFEKNLQCSICEKTFFSKRSLMSHIRIKHNMSMYVEC